MSVVVAGGVGTSDDGAQFELYIRYEKRLPSSQGHVYSGGRVATNVELPVLVEYNLFTLRADHVVYDAEHKTLEASGNVVAASESGATQRADSMGFKIENGQAIPLR